MSATLARRIERLMREAGYNPRSLSLAAALGPTAVRDILEGRIASPRYQTLSALARVLGVGVEQLAGDGDSAPAPEPPARGDVAPLPVPAAIGLRDLPVFGAAEGGSVGAVIISSEPIQWVNRPEPLLTVKGGYGVFVVGESMSPAYEQGDIALIHPALPPRRGADVILVRQEPDGTRHVLLKRLTGWSESAWRLRQYNPPAEFELPRAEWGELQTVVGKYNSR